MKIALIGYGKMGKMIEQIARDRGHEIVSIIDIDNQQDFDSPAFASADVAIEFTAPQAAYGNYLKAWSKGVKVVSGSTGWMKDHGDEVRKACSEEGKTLFWASNFSIGVAIFSAVNRYLVSMTWRWRRRIMCINSTIPVAQQSHWLRKLWRTSTARRLGRRIRQTRSICVWIISAVVRYLASIPSAMILMPT